MDKDPLLEFDYKIRIPKGASDEEIDKLAKENAKKLLILSMKDPKFRKHVESFWKRTGQEKPDFEY